jgi:hypothetical protein
VTQTACHRIRLKTFRHLVTESLHAPDALPLDPPPTGVLEEGRTVRRPLVPPAEAKGAAMLILGVILLILGAVLDIPILWTLGIILAVVGAILWLAGSMGHAVGGRAHYW